ncbi:FkbM family methyltransferase [Mycolicibacterium sp. XJ1819]
MNRAAKVGKLARILPVAAWRRALARHRVAAAVEHVGVLGHLAGLRTVVDVGANRGQFALAARHCHPEARIVSFEPLAAPAATFRAVFAGDTRTSLVNAAVGPAPGEAVIHVSARDDSSSLLPITAAQNTLFPGTAEVDTDTVRVTRLAEHVPAADIETPALLKIDVQGFELQALAGSDDVLDRFEWVYVECSFLELYAGQAFADDVIGWLRDHGFALTGIYSVSYDSEGRAVQADFLFTRRAR